MNIDLTGRTAVVTGGTAGIGLATAGLFLDAGANVAICGRDANRLTQAADDLKSRYPEDRLLALPCDVLDKAAISDFAQRTANRFGGVDTLVNNAGQGQMSTYEDSDDDTWREELELKFFGILYPTKAFQPYLEKSGSAAIVCTNSLLARQPEPKLVATAAARAGQLSLIHSMAGELAPKGIRVNSILIGLVESGQWLRRHEEQAPDGMSYEDWLRGWATDKGIPLGRFGKPEEAAWALFYLGTPLSSYTTGSTIDISGGFSRHVG